MKKLYLIFIATLPGIAFAANEGQGIKGIISGSGKLVSAAIIVVGGLGLLAFFWGLLKFIFKSGDVKSHEEGRNQMIWGLIALFVMFSVWGLVRFIGTAFHIQPNGTYNSGSVTPAGNPSNVDPYEPPCGGFMQQPCR